MLPQETTVIKSAKQEDLFFIIKRGGVKSTIDDPHGSTKTLLSQLVNILKRLLFSERMFDLQMYMPKDRLYATHLIGPHSLT